MTARADDPAIRDEDLLWRRILPIPEMLSPQPDGGVRPSSAAFLDGRTGEVSVHLARLTSQEKVLADHPTVGLAEIVAGLPRSLGHRVVSDPQDDDPSHVLICPPATLAKNQRKSHARQMAMAARWVVPPVASP